MQQLSLFDQHEGMSAHGTSLDTGSEQLIEQFGWLRRREGASHRSVLREVSQLRSIARECSCAGQLNSLTTIFGDVTRIARALREPSASISRATGRARLIAVQRFVRLVGPVLGRDAAADLKSLNSLLPARAARDWHAGGTLVAGDQARRRTRGPTLDAVDLHRIVFAASTETDTLRAIRNRALVAVQCFSGLRVEEVIALSWEDVGTDLTAVGYYGPTASVRRMGSLLRLLLPGPSGEALDALRAAIERGGGAATGPVFRASGRSDRPISYRGARQVLVAACRRAGLPAMASADLRAGCAHWLRSQGLSEHEVAAVLGLARVRTVDRLLSRHAALDAQRRVREHREG